jgi:xanthosine utilization system XapX-like protein
MKTSIIIAIVGILVGFGLGTQIFPKIKEKTIEVEKEVVRKDVQTIIKVVTRPDGSKEEVTTIVDHTRENKEYSNTKTISKADWHISASASKGLDTDIYYTVQAEKRILGDIFIGGNITTNKTIGISLGVEF